MATHPTREISRRTETSGGPRRSRPRRGGGAGYHLTEGVDGFLARAGWARAERLRLAGDASNRSYQRLRGDGGETAVLMVSPPDGGEDTLRFVRVARHLSALGLSPPRILSEDHAQGLLLLEDLGDGLYARRAQERPDCEARMYDAAVDVLVRLHREPPPDFVPRYTRVKLTEFAEVAREWYAEGRETSGYSEELDRLFGEEEGMEDVLALRDYHAENLLWLPERGDEARVGLLDFQDALACHRAFDLVSLIEDARRDLARGLGSRLVARYVSATGVDAEAFDRSMALYGAQRNLRILGVFARLARTRGKSGYLKLVPRVWGHLMGDLEHPSLVRLRDRVLRDLPPPDSGHLERLAP